MAERDVSQNLVLASGSPRRRQLLRAAGFDAVVRPAEINEEIREAEAPEEMVRRLALGKARSVAEGSQGDLLVLAADTTVVHRGRILGKPQDREGAVRMLLELRAGTHDVLTALALVEPGSGRELVRVTRSQLEMRQYRRAEVEAYVASGSPLDKAGGYGIQDRGFQPVNMDEFEDCFTNVMGLPLCTLGEMLQQFGWRSEADLVEACFRYRPHALPDHVETS